MKPSQLKNTIKALYPIKRTICIESAPGGGKSTIVKEVAEELGVPCISLHMPTTLVEDFGIPYLTHEEEYFSYKLPHWFPKEPEGILLLDDRNQADPAIQKVLANLCQERTLHGNPLPDGWMVVSTGNRQSDRSGSNRVLGHLRNRETVLSLDVDLNDWVSWAVNNNTKSELISFLNLFPNLLSDYDPHRDINPTPRSWIEGVNNVMDLIPENSYYECFAGAVGEEAAAKLTGFLKIAKELPDPDEVIANATTHTIPKKVDVQYALVGALAYRATVENFADVMTYVSRMSATFSTLLVTIAVSKNRELQKTRAYSSWIINNEKVLI